MEGSSSFQYEPMDASLSLTSLVEARRGANSSGGSSNIFSAFNSPTWTPFFNGTCGPVQSFWASKNDPEDYNAFTNFESLSVDALLSADEAASSSPASTSESETQQRTIPSSSLPLPAWNSSSNLRADAGFSFLNDDDDQADDEAGANSDKEQGANDVWFAPAAAGTTLHRKRRMALVPRQMGSRKSSLSDVPRLMRRRSLSPFAKGSNRIGSIQLEAEKSVRQCVSAPDLPVHDDDDVVVAPPASMPVSVDETFGKVESRIHNLLAELGWSQEKANAVLYEAMDADSQEQQQQQQQQYQPGHGEGGAMPSGMTSAGALFQRRAHMRERSTMPSPSPVQIPNTSQPIKSKKEDDNETDAEQQQPQPHSATLPLSSLSDVQKQRLMADLQASQVSQQTAIRLGIFHDFVTPSQQFSGQDSSERAARAVQAALLYGMEGKGPNMSPGGQRRPSTASSVGSASTNGLVTPITPFNGLASATKFTHQQPHQLLLRQPSRTSTLSTPSSAFHNLSMQDQALPSASMVGPSSSLHQNQTFAFEVPSAADDSQSSLSFSTMDFGGHFQQQQQQQQQQQTTQQLQHGIGAFGSSEDFGMSTGASTDFMTLGNSLGLSSVPRQPQGQFQQQEQDKNPAVIDSSSYGHIFGGMPHVQLFQQHMQMQEQQQQQQQQMQTVTTTPSKKKSPTKTRSSPNLRTTPPATEMGDASFSTPSKSPRRIASNRRLTLSSNSGGVAVPPLPKESPMGSASKAEKHLRRHSHASLSSEAGVGGSSSAKSPLAAGKFAFVNYGMEDAEELCSAVAPSGSYKVPLKGYGSSDEATPGDQQQDDEEGGKSSKKGAGRSRTRTRTKSHGSLRTGPRWEPVEEDSATTKGESKAQQQHRRRQSGQQQQFGGQQQPAARSLQHFEPIPQLLQFQQLFFDVHGDEVGADGSAAAACEDDDDDEEAQVQQNKVKRRKSTASLNKKASRENVAAASKARRHRRTSTGA